MEIGRRHLPHEIPDGVTPNPVGEVFFITVCCEPRGLNQLACPERWRALVETILHREAAGDLQVRLVLAMPDHWHGLLSFDGGKRMRKVVANLKAWLARKHGIRWQRDFFDHRLRSWESAAEKGEYIRRNPVRAGLIAGGSAWPYLLDRIERSEG